MKTIHLKASINHIKDELKNLAHRLPYIPYRKKSKRYKAWNRSRESRFLQAVKRIYEKNHGSIDAVKVAIAMPVYNRAFCLGKAINSVLKQIHTNWKLIIVDDGSTDFPEAALEPYLVDDRIQLIETVHGGVSHARNTALQVAEGSYVFYLDTDNVWYPHYLRTMVTFMEAGRLQACYAGAKIIDDDGSLQGYFGEDFNWDECHELNHIDINCFAHQRILLEQGFRFDEDMRRLVDWDFILSITAHHRTAFAPFIGVEYYDGSRGDRITLTEHLGDDINLITNKIRKKHLNVLTDPSVSDINIRPRWKSIIRGTGLVNDLQLQK